MTLGAAALPACGDNEGRFAGFRMGIQSWTWRAFPLADALRMTAELGFDRIELSWYTGHLPFPAPLEEADAIRAQLDAHRLACVTTHVEPSGAGHEAHREVFAYVRRLGARTNMMDAHPDQRDSLEELAIEYDVRVGIHNHTASQYTRIEHVLEAIDGRDRRFGTIVDTGHYARAGVDPVEAIRAFEGRLFGVHLKDVAAANPAAPDAILGRGVVDVVGVFRALREVGFPADASISLEYEENPEAPYDDVAAALEHAAAAARASR